MSLRTINGSNYCPLLTANPHVQPGKPFTLMAWVQLDATLTDFQCIASTYDGTANSWEFGARAGTTSNSGTNNGWYFTWSTAGTYHGWGEAGGIDGGSAVLSTGIWYHLCVVYGLDGSSRYSYYQDAVKLSTSAGTPTAIAAGSRKLWLHQSNDNAGAGLSGKTSSFRMFDGCLSLAEIQELRLTDNVPLKYRSRVICDTGPSSRYAQGIIVDRGPRNLGAFGRIGTINEYSNPCPVQGNPLIWVPPRRKLYYTASASSPVSVTPSTLALTLTTFAPTVAAPRLVTPGVKALTLTTFAPTVSTPRVVTPGVRSLTLTTFAPTVLVPRLVTPGVKSLALTGFAPTVSTPRTVTPGSLALSLSTFAPSVATPVVGTPATASLTLTKFAPTVTGTTTEPTPTPSTGGGGSMPAHFAPRKRKKRLTPVEVEPATLRLVLTTYPPEISTPVVVTPDPAAIVFKGFPPGILLGYAPKVIMGLVIRPAPAPHVWTREFETLRQRREAEEFAEMEEVIFALLASED